MSAGTSFFFYCSTKFRLMRVVLVRYGELALKSDPVRRLFEHTLLRNIQRALTGERVRMRRVRGRIFLYTRSPVKTARRVSSIPGVISCSPALEVPADPDAIIGAAIRIARRKIRPGQTFAVRARRHGSFPLTSQEINERVGEAVLKAIPGIRVDLRHPQLEIGVEIWDGHAYLFERSLEGIGGLPVGTQGKVLVWFEGRQEDLEAAQLMLKKGCEVELVLRDEKVFKKIKPLLRHHSPLSAILLPTRELQKYLTPHPDHLRRRALTLLLSEIGRLRSTIALVFSDDASTIVQKGLSWVGFVDRSSSLPVLRPLLGGSLLKRIRAAGSRPRPETFSDPGLAAKVEKLVGKIEVKTVWRT